MSVLVLFCEVEEELGMEEFKWWWKSSSRAHSGQEVIHLNIEESEEELQLKLKRAALVKACLSSVFVIVAAVLIGLLFTCINYAYSSWNSRGRMQEYHKEFLRMGSNASIAMHLRKLTAEPHVAGTPENFATADYVLSSFRNSGLDAHYKDYNVLLTYPVSRSLSLLSHEGTTTQLKLREREQKGDPFSKSSKVIPGFHAYSPSGEASAELVYANYGRVEDFAMLAKMGINASGAIIIARQGNVFRGDVVKNSAEAGALAVVMYSDPHDYGANSSQAAKYPNSKWLPNSGVQRGTVLESSGDPLSPGWPSNSFTSSERLSPHELKTLLPSIPSLPISAEDALLVMSSLGGPIAPPHWHGALDIPAYRLGRGPAILNFSYVANQTIAPIRNVFAVIQGREEPDRYVLLGNHRDAWTFGAVDPNSGTATLLNIAERFGKLVKQGWQPQRSLILASWDAEEYGSIGSTEWVEQNFDLLYFRAVAYINVDCAVAGPGFFAFATPQLDNLLQQAMHKVADPEDATRTVYQSWRMSNLKSKSTIGRLGGGGSDFAPFLHHVGVPAVDIFFGKDYPVYHSLYDNYMWMENFGDPLFQRHVAVAGIWGILALNLADEEILPFHYENYADELESYTRSLKQKLETESASHHVTTAPLHEALWELRTAIVASNYEHKKLEAKGCDAQRREFNDRLLMAERAFTHYDGLPGRPWYKHLIYGPTTHNDYESTSFPGVSESLNKAVRLNSTEEWSSLQHEIWRVARAIQRVAQVLHGHLT